MMGKLLLLAYCTISVSAFSSRLAPPGLLFTEMTKHLSTSRVPRYLFPSGHALEDVFQEETKGQWPRPLLLLDFDNCPAVIEEKLLPLMLICRAAAITLRVVTSTEKDLSNLHICSELQLYERSTNDRILEHVLSVERNYNIQNICQHWLDMPQSKVMIVTTEEYDKDKLCGDISRRYGLNPTTDIDIISFDTQLLCPFWKDALEIDRLSDLKQMAKDTTTAVFPYLDQVLSYLDHSNPVGRLNEMQQNQDQIDMMDITFTELPYIERFLKGGDWEFCVECRISNKKQQLRSIGYGYNLKSAKGEAAYSMLAQLALEALNSEMNTPFGWLAHLFVV